MLRTFNCGVGFCMIVAQKKINNNKKIFTKNYMPYEIGYISKNQNKINLSKTLKW